LIRKRLKPTLIGMAVAIGALALAACGSDSAAPATASGPYFSAARVCYT